MMKNPDRHFRCPHCSEIILDYSKYCPNCERLILTDNDISDLRDWLYASGDKGKRVKPPINIQEPVIHSKKNFLGIDQFTIILLRGGLDSYQKHLDLYSGLLLIYVVLYMFAAGLFSVFGDITFVIPGLTPEQMLVGGGFNFLVTWILATIAQLYGYRKPLETGEMGIQFQFIGSEMKALGKMMVMSVLLIIYFILWALVFKTLFLFDFGNYFASLTEPKNVPKLFEQIIFASFVLIILIMILVVVFIFVVKTAYVVYQFDIRTGMPEDCIDGTLLFIGIIYGFGVFLISLLPFFGEIMSNIIIFVLPGVFLIPIFSYAMAHLKTALSAITD